MCEEHFDENVEPDYRKIRQYNKSKSFIPPSYIIQLEEQGGVTKGDLIAESFSFWLNSPRKMYP